MHYAAAIEGTEDLLKLLIEQKANTLVQDMEGCVRRGGDRNSD